MRDWLVPPPQICDKYSVFHGIVSIRNCTVILSILVFLFLVISPWFLPLYFQRLCPEEAWNMSKKAGNSEKEHSSFLQLFVACIKGGLSGAFAGFLQVLCFMWLRTVMNVQYANGGDFITIFSSLWSEGGILRFYRGFVFAIFQNPLVRFGDVAANTAGIILLGGCNISLVTRTAITSFCSSLWRLLLTPVEYLKTSMQVHGRRSSHLLRERCSREGFRVFWTGGFAMLITNWASTFTWFASHNFLEVNLPIFGSGLNSLNFRQALIGFSSSLFSDSCTNGIRVVKTVTQTRSNMNYSDSIKLVLHEGGLPALLGRGLTTRIFTNAIQSSVFTVIWKSIERQSSIKHYSSEREWLPTVCSVTNDNKEPCSSEISNIQIKCPNSINPPLRDLSKGKIPAIIIQNVLTKREVSYLLQDTEKLRQLGKVSLRKSLKSRTKEEFFKTLKEASVREKELLHSDLRSSCGVQKMRSVFNNIAYRERKVFNSSYTSKDLFFPSVSVRENQVGSGLVPTHFDSLHSSQWDKRPCKKEKKIYHLNKISSWVKMLPTYGFGHTLGMILLLRASSESSGADNVVKIYRANFHDLVNVCSVEGRSHGIGVNVNYFSEWMKYNNTIHTSQVNMSTGDMYIFNANYVHEVQQITGNVSRMTMASFLAYDDNLRSILPWI